MIILTTLLAFISRIVHDSEVREVTSMKTSIDEWFPNVFPDDPESPFIQKGRE